MIVILVKLIAAHLLGDFVFQSDKLCRMKNTREHSYDRLMALSLHSLIQSFLSYVFIGQWCNWLLPTVIFISHFLIDYIKSEYGKKNLKSFIKDQFAHYAVILCLWYYMRTRGYNNEYDLPLLSSSAWMIVTSYIAVLTPTSILIKLFMDYENWVPADSSLKGLPNAGKWIGFMERFLILTFIYSANVEGIGFLLAAKSIFRFGELNKAKDIKVTEYVLIGTFASFTIAIILGIIVQWINTFGKELI